MLEEQCITHDYYIVTERQQSKNAKGLTYNKITGGKENGSSE